MVGYDASKDFRTKLSLPKFVSLIKRLTLSQKKLLADIGFEKLLYVTCEYLPRSLIAFLVANFDSQTRSLSLTNGFSLKLNASCINKVLGTPVGGLRIGPRVDPFLRTVVADLTNCKGHYPTIAELDKVITTELDGDTFKIVFTMYAMTTFLCPSSHDAISPDYLHIVKNAGHISSFDFSSAILLKLVSSIEAYNGGTTCVLGGNLFCLMVQKALYFEFLDTDLILSHVKCKTKEISRTPFGNLINEGQTSERNSYEDLLEFVLSITPLDSHEVVKAQVPLIISKMQKDIMDTIQPIVIQNVMSLLSLTSATSARLNTVEKCQDQCGIGVFKVPSHALSACHTPPVQSNTIPLVICIFGQATSSKISDVVTMSDVDCEKNEHVCNDGCLLPVPGDDILDRSTEHAIKDGDVPDIHSIISAMEALPSPSSLGLPCNFELLEQMNPAKPDFTQYDDSASAAVDILQYVLDQAAEERNDMVTSDMQSPLLFEKVDFSIEMDSVTRFRKPNASSSPCNQILSSNKRNALMSTNDFVSESDCLIKRPRMFEINNESAVQRMDPGGIDTTNETCFNEADSSFMSPINSRIAHTSVEAPETSYSWDDSDFDRELLRTTLQAEAEHESKLHSTQFPSSQNQAFNVTEISPNKVISVFESTLVEKDVFNDIVHRVPKTAKSKTINIVRMGSTWAEHRVFALSMQVLNLLPEGHWKRYFIPCEESALFAKPYENPGTLSRVISHNMIGFKIDSMDLVHLPLTTYGFYYLLVVNFRLKLFKVLYPNTKFRLVSDHVEVAIKNFKMAFNLSYKHSLVKVDNMQTIYRSVCSSEREYTPGYYPWMHEQNKPINGEGGKVSMSTSVTEETRVQVSKFLLSKLGVTVGPVTDLFLVKNLFCHQTVGVFKCLHIINKLIDTEFDFIVNQSRQCEIFVRCTTPAAFVKLVDVLPLTFNFDDARVKISKINFLEALPEDEDIFFKEPVKTFAASMENRSISQQKFLGYQVGYSDVMLDMESEQNIRMADTTMKILGEMSYITKSRRPSVTRHVMSRLGEYPGAVSDLYLFHVIGFTRLDGIFHALALAKKLLTREFQYTVNQSSKTKVFIRPSGTVDKATLEATSEMKYRLDHRDIKIIKIAELHFKSAVKDLSLNKPLSTFPCSYYHLSVERMSELSYPVGYSSEGDDIDSFVNTIMSASTMSLLGVSEGAQAGLLNVNFKYFAGPPIVGLAIDVIPPNFEFRHAVDQNGNFYMKFRKSEQAEAVARRHYFIGGYMIKFYYVNTVAQLDGQVDKGNLPFYGKGCHEDFYERI
ncbi:hypothetical protein ACQ4PT_049301 [Festuca glaucescens]